MQGHSVNNCFLKFGKVRMVLITESTVILLGEVQGEVRDFTRRGTIFFERNHQILI